MTKALPFNGDSFLQDEFLNLRDKYKIKEVVETGTYHGVTTEWLAQNFEKVVTIESNPEYLKIARATLKEFSHVQTVEGDSSKDLGKVLASLSKRACLIFLDAHWYKNPVLKELEQIAWAEIKPIIAIHDFKSPNDLTLGYDTYPDQKIVYEWSWIKNHIDNIYGQDNYYHYFNHQATGARRGCVFIMPRD